MRTLLIYNAVGADAMASLAETVKLTESRCFNYQRYNKVIISDADTLCPIEWPGQRVKNAYTAGMLNNSRLANAGLDYADFTEMDCAIFLGADGVIDSYIDRQPRPFSYCPTWLEHTDPFDGPPRFSGYFCLTREIIRAYRFCEGFYGRGHEDSDFAFNVLFAAGYLPYPDGPRAIARDHPPRVYGWCTDEAKNRNVQLFRRRVVVNVLRSNLSLAPHPVIGDDDRAWVLAEIARLET